MLQETKQKQGAPKMKAHNLDNYQVFELRRDMTREEGGKGLGGGGLAMGALHDLKPVLVRQGNDEAECLTMEVTAGNIKIRCVNGYGPQVGDTKERKDKFWGYLEKEIVEAKQDQVGLVIEIDANAWAGKEIIPKDRNTQNSNGKLLEMFLKRNKDIHLVNSLNLCEGVITRKQITDSLNEKSAIDLFLVCSRILPYVICMNVDEKCEHQLTNFYGIRNRGKVTESDHCKIELKLNLQFPQAKPSRTEVYNFKSDECQKRFRELITNTRKFSMCFEGEDNFVDQIKRWERNLKRCIVQSFPKIRSRKRHFSESNVGKLLEERKRMKLDILTNPSKLNTDNKRDIEDKIARATEVDYMKKVQEVLGHIEGDDGGVNTHGLWKAKNSLIPNDKVHNPIALQDKYGNLITNPEGIKKMCHDEIVERLRHRKIHPSLKHLQGLKEMLCKKRINLAKHVKSAPWTKQQFEKVLNSLKNGKCRDPQGFINEIFKPVVAGEDLKSSLLHMLNQAKDSLIIPEMIKIVNVALLPKPGKQGRHKLENQRGIFLISIFRSIMMKLLLNYEYHTLDTHMTDSNIGGRKQRRIQDHLFIVNGIIFENTRNKKEKPISICIYDCRQCFDSLWQEEVINDIYEAGVTSDKLALLYEINKTNYLAVKTQFGLTERSKVEKIICQGDPWGPIQFSVQINGIGRESLEEDLKPFKYKNKVEIPALGMIDDILTISESGYKTSIMNSFITAKIALKKLQFGPQKCFVLHTGKEHDEYKNTELFVDGWSMKTVSNVETGESAREYILEGDMKSLILMEKST